jgi:hypothetical protein
MEAMVFTTLVFVGIQRSLNMTLSRRDVKRLSRSVRVYGDDLIVPVDHVHSVIQTLEAFGSRVGLHKSFWTGKFRESCGKEYYNGADVGIVRVRHVFPTSRQDATEVASLVSLRNQLYMSGYWSTCRRLDNIIEGIIKYFPPVLPSSPVLGRISSFGYCAEGHNPERWSTRYQTPLVKGFVVSARSPVSKLAESGALLKCMLKLGGDQYRDGFNNPTPWLPPGASVGGPLGVYHDATLWASFPQSDSEHLERSGRPQRVSIKLGWSSPV